MFEQLSLAFVVLLPSMQWRSQYSCLLHYNEGQVNDLIA